MASRNVQIVIVAGLLIALGAGAVAWRRCGTNDPQTSTTRDTRSGGPDGDVAHAGSVTRGGITAAAAKAALATVAGVVRSGSITGAPLPGARVCAVRSDGELTGEEAHEPSCAITSPDGAYRLVDLPPGGWTVSASAPAHLAAAWQEGPPSLDGALWLAPGDARAGVDLVLPSGGAEVRGVVLDLGGGPVADAHVEVSGAYASLAFGGVPYRTRTSADGSFLAYAAPGEISVTATADGYARGETESAAPATGLEVLLAPASELTGVVVEHAGGAPVPDALVFAELVTDEPFGGDSLGSTRTDAQGRFRISRLPPGRYLAEAWKTGRHGRAAASVRLGVGETSTDVRVEVHALASARGRVVVDDGQGPPQPCPPSHCTVTVTHASAGFEDQETTGADGQIVFDALVPGTYAVLVSSEFFVGEVDDPPMVVAATDLQGLTWTVRPGGELAGRVRTAAGAPVGGVEVQSAPRDDDGGSGDATTTAADGTFRLRGLSPGAHDLTVGLRSDFQTKLATGQAQISPGDNAAVELVVSPDWGSVHGMVVDRQGRPVAGVRTWLHSAEEPWPRWGTRSDAAGRFEMPFVSPGTYLVATESAGRAQRPSVKVVAGQTATARVVVTIHDGSITGVVVDASGTPVADAYVVSALQGPDETLALEQLRWGSEDRPVLTDVGGAFRLTGLEPGRRTVRAYRKGGGEAIAGDVAVGATVRLVVATAGSIRGTVDAGGLAFETLAVTVRGATGYLRKETFFRTAGAFVVRELPPGEFVVQASAAGAEGSTQVTLADGQDLDGVRVTLVAKVRVRGRLVDATSGAPLAGYQVLVGAPGDPLGADPEALMAQLGDASMRPSAADGTFTTAPFRPGAVQLTIMPTSDRDLEHEMRPAPLEVRGPGPVVDVGDVALARR